MPDESNDRTSAWGPMEAADDALIDRISSGDASALGALYRRHAGSVLAVALRVVGQREVAEDVVHDTFVAVWLNIDRFQRSRGTARAWILTIARNRAIGRLRATRPTIDVDEADEFALLPTSADPTLDEVLRRLARSELREAIDALPEQQREAIYLAYFGGHTFREVADITGSPVGTTNGRVSRGLATLRQRLTRARAVPEPAPVAEAAVE